MRLIILLLMLCIALPVHAQPDRVRVQGANRAPESLECHNGGFLLSSLDEGTVYAVSESGASTPFIEDDDLAQSVGLEIDHATNRLFVVNADFEHPEVAALGIYDLSTGARLHWVNLAALAPNTSQFPNDVAIDPSGAAYVTDSLAPVIYRVDTDGTASLLVEDARLLVDGFSGNGIAYHPDGYLLVGISGVLLYRVPLDAPEDFTVVDLPDTLPADGMLWDEANDSLIVAVEGEILRLASTDDWTSAEVVATAPRQPASAVALCGEAIYRLDPQQNVITRVHFAE